jgi:hypothetical protein
LMSLQQMPIWLMLEVKTQKCHVVRGLEKRREEGANEQVWRV